MTYRLRDNLHLCLCGGRVIFLDLEADRYFCLPRASETAFRRLADGKDDAEDRQGLAPLTGRGLLVDDPASPGLRAAPAIETVTGDLLQEPYPRPRLPDVISTLLAEARAARLLRTRSLLDILEGSCLGGAPARPDDPHKRLRRIASASRTASFLFRASDRCLVRALAVQAMCRRLGIGSKLVFGVRTDPFGAHGWVQLGGVVLVGDYEQVRLYTPIMALG
jgi:hypothetical protein